MKRQLNLMSEFNIVENSEGPYSLYEISELWAIALHENKSFHTLALLCPKSFLEVLYSNSRSNVHAGIPLLSRMIREQTNSIDSIVHGNDTFTEEVLYRMLFFTVQDLFALQCIRARYLKRGSLCNALQRKAKRNWSFVLAAVQMRRLLKLFIEHAYSPDSWYFKRVLQKRFQKHLQCVADRGTP